MNNCESCIHLNELIHWNDGLFYKCMRDNKLWIECDEYEAIE